MSTVFYPGQTDYIEQLNALWDRVTAQVTGTSTSSVAVGTGSKSLTIEANKQFGNTSYVRVARTSDPTIFMAGTVTAYNATTGAMTVSVDASAGAGTYTDWTVTLAGATGSQGPAATLAVGTVTTLAAGASATVSNSGTSGAAVFDFGLPQGATGPSGTLSVGTVSTGAAGSSATVTNSGTSTAAVLDFSIPRGNTGTAATVAVGTVSTGAPGTSVSVTNSGSSSAAVFDFTIPKGDTGSAGVASGADTQLQFNDGGLFSGASGLTWNKATNIFVATGQTSLGGATGAEALRAVQTASAVNRIEVVGTVTGSSPVIRANGSDANVGTTFTTKGTGTHTFATNLSAQVQVQIPHAASAVNFHSIYGAATGGAPTFEVRGSDANINLNLLTKGTGSIGLFTNGGGTAVKQAAIVHTANAVNYVNLQGAITGAGPGITAGGSDSDITLTYSAKGFGGHKFYTAGNTLQTQVTHVASAVNYTSMQGAATGGAVTYAAFGSDSNISINVLPKSKGALGIGVSAPQAKLHVSGDAIGSLSATTSSIDATTDTLTFAAAHGFTTGDCVLVIYGAGTTSGNIPNASIHYVNAPSTTTATLHPSAVEAIAGTGKRDITSVGTATITLWSASRSAAFRMLSNNDTSVDIFSYRNSTSVIDWTTASTRIQSRVDLTPQGYVEFNPSGNSGGVQIGSNANSFVNFYLVDGEQFRITRSVGAVNYAMVTGAAAGNAPRIAAAGADANVTLALSSKGTFGLGFYTNTFGSQQFGISNTASAVNWLQVTGAAATGSPTLSAQGSDTDISLTYTAKGTGSHLFNSDVRAGGGSAVAAQLFGGLTGTAATFAAIGTDTNINARIQSKGTGSVVFFTNGVQQAQFTNTASAVNYVSMTGGVTGANASYSVAGADTDIGISVTGKGSGSVTLRNGNGALFVAQGGTASSVNFIQVSANAAGSSPAILATGTDTNIDFRMRPRGAGAFVFETNVFGNTQVKITDTASAVNYLQLTGGVTGTGVLLSAQGSDANIEMAFTAKGTFGHAFSTGGSYMPQLKVTHTATAVNFATVTGGATGANVVFGAAGTDTDIGLTVAAKGAGSVALKNANGNVFLAQATNASSANCAQVAANPAGTSPLYTVSGSDTNIDWRARPKGGGSFVFETNSVGNTQVKVTDTTSAVNFVQMTGGATGTAPSLTAAGSDTNIDVNIVTKGTGVLKVNGAPLNAGITLAQVYAAALSF